MVLKDERAKAMSEGQSAAPALPWLNAEVPIAAATLNLHLLGRW